MIHAYSTLVGVKSICEIKQIHLVRCFS